MTEPPPGYSPADVRAWWRLIAAADAAVRATGSRGAAQEFRRAADAAFGSVLPSRDPEHYAPFMKLLGFGRSWAALSAEGRRSNAEPCALWVLRCETWMNARFPPPGGDSGGAPAPAPEEHRVPEPGEPGYRADVHG